MSDDNVHARETDDQGACGQMTLRDLIRRGFGEFKNDQYEQASIWFNKAVDLDPNSAEAHAWLAAVYGRQITAAWSMVEKIRLLALLENEIAVALELDPTLPLARRMNGARLLHSPEMMGGDPALAAEEFRYCIEQGMDEAELWVLLAESHVKTEEPNKAADALERALACEPDHRPALELLRQLEGRQGGDGKANS